VYNVCSKGKITIESDGPLEQPPPEAEAAAAAAAAKAAVANDYNIIKELNNAEGKLDKDDGERDEDPTYESIREDTACDSSIYMMPQPQRNASYKNLCDVEIGQSSTA